MSGGFWGKTGNENDSGDLDKLKNIGLIAACPEQFYAYTYEPWWPIAQLRGRGKFTVKLEDLLKLDNRGIAPADYNRDGKLTFEELKTAVERNYTVAVGEGGVIRDINSPWLEQDIEVVITDPNNIVDSYSEHVEDFDPNSSILSQKLLGDLDVDKVVDINDLSIFSWRWLKTGCNSPRWCEGADINYDGKVNFIDFSLLANNWLKQNP